MQPSELLPSKKFFRPDEVAQVLDLSRRTVYRMIHESRLGAVKPSGGCWRVPRQALEDLLSGPLSFV
jgi:excisionase family DNA binding protein